MQKRFVIIWFCNLKTDWFTRRNSKLAIIPFVLAAPNHGKMVITDLNIFAQQQGITKGMSVADARAIFPSLQVLDDNLELTNKLIGNLAEWCIRFTPAVAIDNPDVIILDASGCAHLWGGEQQYLNEIKKRFTQFGYTIRIAMADTIGAAWAIAHYGNNNTVVETNQQLTALLSLPVAALRLENETVDRLQKLGLRQIQSFITMPRPALRRRFGKQLLSQIDKATGDEEECIELIHPVAPYQERLSSLEPIVTLTGIEIALQHLLEIVCRRLQKEEKGLRTVLFICYRTDGKIEKINIGTNRPSCNTKHLFKLFEIKINSIAPGPGIELFILEAAKVEEISAAQVALWKNDGPDNVALSELLDRIAGKMGLQNIKRYVPEEHYWPERSFKESDTLNDLVDYKWKTGRPRPLHLLQSPQRIEVTAPIPDYPPMLFRYKGILHKIIKADGPERIEQEWWLQEGQHRDYYYVEDESGKRFWLFRSGHYDASKNYQWFLHGFFP